MFIRGKFTKETFCRTYQNEFGVSRENSELAFSDAIKEGYIKQIGGVGITGDIICYSMERGINEISRNQAISIIESKIQSAGDGGKPHLKTNLFEQCKKRLKVKSVSIPNGGEYFEYKGRRIYKTPASNVL